MKKILFLCSALVVSLGVSFAQPVMALAGSDVTICSGSSTPLNGQAVFGTPPYTYSWSPVLGLSNPNIANPTANPLSTTVYTLTVTDAVSGVSSDAVQVSVVSLPTVSCGSNSPVCEGQTINITSTTSAVSPSYSWTGPNGFTDTNQNPNVTGYTPWAGIYNLTVTDLFTGCSNYGTTTVVVYTAPIVSVTNGTMCAGGTCVLTASGASTYNWSPSLELSSSTGATVTAFCVATTTINVSGTDGLGCVSLSPATATVTVNANPSVVAVGDNVCTGSTAILSATGASAYSWAGPNSFTSTSASPAIVNATIAEAGTYTVTGTGFFGCTATYTVGLNVNPSTDIAGHVTYSGGNVSSGSVFLIAQGLSSALFDTVATSPLSPSGHFTFSSALSGNYYVRAESTMSPSFVNTYYGNEYLWDSALVVSHGCAQTDSANVSMIELAALSGSASISGTVYEGIGFGQKLIAGPLGVMTNVIPGVPVKVGKNPGGAIVASTLTDAGGIYTFNNLSIDNYKIYTDIPGYPMDSSYSVSITGSETVVNLDYFVDSNSVYIDLTQGSPSVTKDEIIYTVYPNPTSGKINIRFEKNAAAETIRLFDMNGRVVYSAVTNSGNNMQIDLNSLGISNGIYLLDVQNTGKKFKINYLAEN